MQTLLFSASFQIGRQSSSVVEQRTHKPLVGSSNLPFGTILKTLTSREHGRFFCAGINSEGIFEGSNVTEAAQRAPAAVILRCAADGRSARHLRAAALRLPFGTILKTLTSRESGRFFCASMSLPPCALLRCRTHTRYHTNDACKTTLTDGLQGRSPLPIVRYLHRRPAQFNPGIKPITTQKPT